MRQLCGRGGWWATLSAVMALAQLRNASLCEGSRVAYAAKVFVPTLAAHALPHGGAAGVLRLRGGYGAGPGAFSDESRGVVEEDEFFRKFGSGPGGMDLSGSRFEVRPDSFNDTESLMDGIGLWDYPEEQRLVGEHHTPRVGYRVRTSLHLREFWSGHNFTDYTDGWDHLSDRLGTIIGVTDDGRTCEVTWDAVEGKEGITDWYATGYLTNYFLSLAEDELQPKFPDDKGVNTRIKQLEEELRNLRRTQGIDEDGNIIGVI